jgi:effector-binding domain-containing protein
VEPDRVDLEPTPTAVVRAEMAMGEIPQQIGPLFNAVYSALPTSPAHQDGQNIAVYTPQDDGRVRVEVGVQVAEPFSGSEELACSNLPSGPALRHRHVGSYGQISRAFDEMLAWAGEHDLAVRGVSLEIYGDHDPDPSRLVTDLYVMLAD